MLTNKQILGKKPTSRYFQMQHATIATYMEYSIVASLKKLQITEVHTIRN